MRHLKIVFFTVFVLCISGVSWAEEISLRSSNQASTLTLAPTHEIAPLKMRSKHPEPHIALLLPLKSIPFWQDAEALKQGFFAAIQNDTAFNHNNSATETHDDLPVWVYECEEEGRDLPALYEQAVANGAVAVVAGLTLGGFNALAHKIKTTVPTLTLYLRKDTYRDVNVFKYRNSSITTKVADNAEQNSLYFFGISPEDEARLVAKQAIGQGHRFATIVTNRRSWSRVLGDAFYREYVRVGANARKRIIYTGDPSVFYPLRNEKRLTILLAINGDEAKEILPLLPKDASVYATSRIFDHRTNNKALAGVQFADMPWILHADNPTAFDYASASKSLSPERERLYALGIDAHNLMRLLLESLGAAVPVSKFSEMNGVSGTIQLVGSTFNRSAVLVKFSGDGDIVYNNPRKPVYTVRPQILTRRYVAQKPFEFVADEQVLTPDFNQGFNPADFINPGGTSDELKDIPQSVRDLMPRRKGRNPRGSNPSTP